MEQLLENRKNYDNDLELAAELGKILLERNRELESQVLQLQQILEEKDQGTGLLQKQVEVLRHANDSRMRIYEEVDKNAQELEKANTTLRISNKEEKDKVKRLNETIEALESKCDEFQVKLEQLKREKNSRQKKTQDVAYNRTWSVPSLVDDNADYKGLSPGSYDYLGFPSLNESWKKKKKEANVKEIKDLKDSVKLFKLQYYAEQKRRVDLEGEVTTIQGDKVNLLAKVTELQDDILKREELKREIATAAAGSNASLPRFQGDKCAKCSTRAASITGSDLGDSEFFEHDLDDVPHKEVVRLKCGGSAYGSRESLNQIGLEAVTPTLESCSDILAVAVHQSEINNTAENANTTQPDPDSTLLGELEEQYRKLVKKYEHLVEIKKNRKAQETKDAEAQINASFKPSTSKDDVVRRRPKSLTLSKEVQTAWRKSSCLDFTSPVDPTVGHFQSGPPEYKKLFKEIFETLKRSADIDSDTSPSP